METFVFRFCYKLTFYRLVCSQRQQMAVQNFYWIHSQLSKKENQNQKFVEFEFYVAKLKFLAVTAIKYPNWDW